MDAALIGETSPVGLDGVADRLEAFGVELAVYVAHAGFVVDPGPPARRPALGFGIRAAVIAAKHGDQAPHPTGEQIDRFIGGRRHEAGIVQLLALLLIELPHRSDKDVDLSGTDTSSSNSGGDVTEFAEHRRACDFSAGHGTGHRPATAQKKAMRAPTDTLFGQPVGGRAQAHRQTVACPLHGTNRRHQSLELGRPQHFAGDVRQ